MSSIELFYDTDSDDEEPASGMAVERKILRDKSNPLQIPDDLFIKYFRLNKDAFNYLLTLLTAKLKNTVRSSSVKPVHKLAAALRFFAEGGYQTGHGNEYLVGVAQPTFSINFTEVIDIFETELCPELIKFPSGDDEKLKIKRAFYEKYGFPGVIGCVDGTHVKIIGPAKTERHLYYNRKGYYSLNVMLVCDDQLRVRYVDANHPGSCHDSFIFNSSELDTELQRKFEDGETNTWLLGDAGYALKPYLIVPFRSTREESEPRTTTFNKKHEKARNIMERTIGVLKNRFRCLLGERQLHYCPDKARQILNVCCALHNLCTKYNIGFEEPIILAVEDQNQVAPLEDDREQNIGERIRLNIMNAIC